MTDRDQVAREVLTELANWNMARVETLKDATRFRDERYPAPAAPVTVTVGDWKCSVVPHARDCIVEHIQRAQLPFTSPQGAPLYECVLRIASDARRIEELEAANASLKAETDRISAMRQDALGELVRVGHERDEARRALEEKQDHDALRAAQERSHATTGRLVREMQQTSPAPIPLGAVVESVEYAYRFARYTHDWECMQGDPPVGHPVDVEVSALCTALYRALHPVADAATVKRVAQAIFRDRWRGDKGMRDGVRDTYCNDARAALRALGYTIQEGEA